MIRKLIVLGVVLAALAAGDVAVKSKAESEIAKRARVEAGASARASAHIKSFPFVARLLASGSAGDVTLTLHDVQGQSIRFSTLSISLVNLKLDRSKMFKGKAYLTHVDRGTITVGLDAAALQSVIHYPVGIADGRLFVTVTGRRFAVTATTGVKGTVHLQAQGLPPIDVPIPQTRLASCPVDRVAVQDNEVRASCDVNEIPPALLKAASGVVNQ
jgi:LmeA-like phospholipid-binding